MTTLLIFALPQLPVAAVAPLRTLQSSDTMTPPLSSHNNIPTLSCTPLTPRQTSNFKSLTLMFVETFTLIRESIEAHR